MGKSELLAKWVWDLSEDKQANQLYQHIFFIDCSNGLETAFEGNSLQARMLDIQSDDLQKLTSAQATLTEYNQDGKLLLVLDDLPWDDSQFKHNANLVNQFKKVADCVIATSRRKYSNFQPIAIGTLEEDTVDLFKSYYQKDIATEDLAMVNEIIQRAGLHTLTIEILAKMAYENDWSISELLETLENADFDYKELTTEVEYTKSDNTEEQTLSQALQALFDISQLDTEQKEILYHLSCMNSQIFTLKAVENWLDIEIPTIKKLIRMGWIQENITYFDNDTDKNRTISSYQLHQTVTHTIKHAFINNVDELERHQQMNLVAERMELSYQNSSHQQINYLYLSAIVNYFLESIGHILALEDIQRQTSIYRVLEFSVFLITYALYSLGADLLIKARETIKLILGENHPDYALSLQNLAEIYRQMGNCHDALHLYKQAMLITKTAVGKSHPNYATILNNLAVLYADMERNDDALDLYQQVIEITKTLFGENNQNYVSSLNNLASLYYKIGRYENALPLYQKCIKIDKKILGHNNHNYAISLNNLAALYESMGKNEEALSLSKQSIEIIKKTLGDSHPLYATSLNGLACSYKSMGRYADALPLYNQAIDIIKITLGEKHPDYTIYLSNLIVLCADMGMLEDDVQITEKSLGMAHPKTVRLRKIFRYLKQQPKK